MHFNKAALLVFLLLGCWLPITSALQNPFVDLRAAARVRPPLSVVQDPVSWWQRWRPLRNTDAQCESIVECVAEDAFTRTQTTVEEAFNSASALVTSELMRAEALAEETLNSATAASKELGSKVLDIVNQTSNALVSPAAASQREMDPLLRLSSLVRGILGSLPGMLLASRTLEIWTFVADIAYKIALANRSGEKERKEAVGEELCEGLLRLGPTFIKLGQILSTRYDILPYDYVKALERLQDAVPPFDGQLAYQTVVDEVGADKFASFEMKPIAAASLGQVHLATTADGTRVAVKVQRPGLRALFDADLQNLKVLAEMLRRLDGSPDSMLRDWREIFESNAKILYEEIDYTKEAANGERFARNFQGVEWVKVPEPVPQLSSARVLTMEYVPGTKISDVRTIRSLGLDPTVLARRSGEAFMIQLLRHGFFHCDPHPGNIAVDTKGPNGSARLVFYDFGMVDELSPSFRKALVDGFFALYEGNAKEIVDALIAGELLGGRVDRVSVESITRFFLGSFRERLALDRASAMTPEEREQMRMSTMRQIGNELAAVASDRPFRYPRALPYVLRAFNALEGVGKALDPNYDVTRIAKRYLTELIDLRDGSAAITAIKKAQYRLGWRRADLASVVQAPRRVTQVYETLTKLESGELQLRVRALELERAMVRNSVMQRASLYAILTCCSLNVATILCSAAVSAGASPALAGLQVLTRRFAFGSAAYFSVRVLMAVRTFGKLQRGENEGNLNEYLLESKRGGLAARV